MSLASASDLRSMLRTAGEVVVFNGVTSYGILDISDAIDSTDQGGMVQVRVTTVLVATDDFENLRTDGRITVAGKPYRIDNVSPQDDGALTQLKLSRAS